MAEIEITLPTVQYGNVKVKATPEELDELIKSADSLGTATAIYLNIFTQGFKAGAKLDVSAPQEATSAPVSASQEYSQEGARRLLEEGLGGVTELPEEDEYDSATEAKEATQARTAPWAEPAVDAPKKPWETETKPEPVAELSNW